MILVLGTRNTRIRRAHQAEEIEVHAIRIRRVGTMTEDPRAATEDVEGYVWKDAVVKVIDQLCVIQLREVRPHGRALDLADCLRDGWPHVEGTPGEGLGIDTHAGEKVLANGVCNLSVIRVPRTRDGELQ